MNSSIQIIKIVLVLCMPLTFGSLFSQNSDSFLSTDRYPDFDPASPNIYKASFLLAKVDTLLKRDFEYAQIGILEFNGDEYFTMYGLKKSPMGSVDTIYSIISDFPCPKQCLPPESKKEKTAVIKGAETFLIHKFDKADLDSVRWQHIPGMFCVNIKRAIRGYNFTLAIYAVTQDASGVTERVYIPHDKVYISVNTE